jgi:anaerobic magnesium-protoporphyrin IX monomethyl ester cyclase
MKILLVNPRFDGKSEIPPLGLASVASPLLEADFDVSILDLDVEGAEDRPGDGNDRLLQCLQECRPSIVGVTALSNSFASARHVLETVKAADPRTLTVLGGIHASGLFKTLLRDHEAIDVIVRGEGEVTFPELARRFAGSNDLDGIRGISYRRGGRIVHNDDRPLMKDLDHFPIPAHHLVDGGRYRTRSISSSRGCAHDCTFCSIQSQYHRIVRFRGAGRLIEEIQGLLYFGAKRIMFTDDNFTFSLKRLRELCAEMVRQGFNGQAAFYAQGRMDDICRNPFMAGMLSEAGFRAIYVGAESGSAEVLSYYRKGIHPEEVLRGASFCIEQNLTPVVNFILLGPRDTPDTIRQTIRLARKLFENGAEIAYTEALIPYPGTPIRDALERDGKYREAGEVYYFESYRDLNMDWFLHICDCARVLTRLFHGMDSHFEARKTYYELSYIDNLLEGRVPPKLESCRGNASGHVPADDIEALYRQTVELIRSSGGH